MATSHCSDGTLGTSQVIGDHGPEFLVFGYHE